MTKLGNFAEWVYNPHYPAFGAKLMATKIQDKDIIPYLDPRIKEFKGQIPTLEQAIGVWVVGRKSGLESNVSGT